MSALSSRPSRSPRLEIRLSLATLRLVLSTGCYNSGDVVHEPFSLSQRRPPPGAVTLAVDVIYVWHRSSFFRRLFARGLGMRLVVYFLVHLVPRSFSICSPCTVHPIGA